MWHQIDERKTGTDVSSLVDDYKTPIVLTIPCGLTKIDYNSIRPPWVPLSSVFSFCLNPPPAPALLCVCSALLCELPQVNVTHFLIYIP